LFVACFFPRGKPIGVSFPSRFVITAKSCCESETVHQLESQCDRWLAAVLECGLQPSVTFAQVTVQKPEVPDRYTKSDRKRRVVRQ
jgi:hypothetical protein